MAYPYAAPVSPMTSSYPGGPAPSAYPFPATNYSGAAAAPVQASAYPHSPYAGQAAAPAPASAYPHSPYAAPAATPAPAGAYLHSPYAASAAMPPPANAYPHSPYAGSLSSTLAPAGPTGYHSAAPSPHTNPMQFPQAGTAGTAAPAAAQPFGANVQPGAVTYTTTTDALGRVTYHHFRAEPSSYRSPQGVTYTGIQWVPTETSTVPPVGIAPAGPDVLASFRGQLPGAATAGDPQVAAGRDPRDEKAYREWEKEKEREEHRRRKEEKQATKRNSVYEAERRAREKAEERELRKVRERDAFREVETERVARTRRLSNVGGMGAGLAPSGAAYGERDLRERSRERVGDLERRMGDLNVSGRGLTAEYGAPPVGTRSRRQSMSMPSPGAVGNIYDEPASYERERFDDYGPPGGQRRSSLYGAPERAERAERTASIYGAPERASSIYGAPERGGTVYGGSERGGTVYGGSERGGTVYGAPERASSIYGAPERSPYRRGTSPLPGTMGLGPEGAAVYPAGHIYAGQPISRAPSRSHSPIPGTAPYPSASGPGAGIGGGVGAPGGYGVSPRIGSGGVLGHSPRPREGTLGLSPRIGGGAIPGVSPRIGGGMPLAGAGAYGVPPAEQMLASPEAFSRPINRAQTFTPFTMIRVQDMDDFLDNIIQSRPPVLGTHDVMPEDWGRLMNDLALAWKGSLPLPNGGPPPKPSELVKDLLDLWNHAFFFPRGVELVLYKGRNCVSGRGARLPETRLREESSDSYASSEGLDDSLSEPEGYVPPGGSAYGGHYGIYGRKADGYDRGEERHRRQQRKEEERVRKAVEKAHLKEQLKRKYILFLSYVPVRDY
ncbi:hypothetical protein DFH11DRAFT_1645252 [Phellopilus nigrolimitatus]|nr:hypothetical protein DFH11DRAFT_1645252 [Phellopilus nigrolimitatus]